MGRLLVVAEAAAIPGGTTGGLAAVPSTRHRERRAFISGEYFSHRDELGKPLSSNPTIDGWTPGPWLHIREANSRCTNGANPTEYNSTVF